MMPYKCVKCYNMLVQNYGQGALHVDTCLQLFVARLVIAAAAHQRVGTGNELARDSLVVLPHARRKHG